MAWMDFLSGGRCRDFHPEEIEKKTCELQFEERVKI